MLKDYDFSETHVDKVKRSELGEEFAKLQRQLNKTDSICSGRIAEYVGR